MSASRDYDRFPTTHWSQVARAADADPSVKRQALEHLLRRYLPAFAAHLRCRRHIDPDRADDLVQGFVCDQVIANELIARADKERGRFRSLLLKALDRYVKDVRRFEGAARRTPSGGVLELGPLADSLADNSPVGESFDVAWARQTVRAAIDRMRERCRPPRDARIWLVFRCRVLEPIFHGTPPPPYEKIIERFGFQSPMQASNVLVTSKRLFARCLRSVIGEYVRDPAEVDSELRELWTLFANASTRDDDALSFEDFGAGAQDGPDGGQVEE